MSVGREEELPQLAHMLTAILAGGSSVSHSANARLANLTECGSSTDGPVSNGYFSRNDNKLNAKTTYNKLSVFSQFCQIDSQLELVPFRYLSFQASNV